MMEKRLEDKAPDPGTLWLAIGIGVFSVLASFVLAIYYSNASPTGSAQANTATDPMEATIEAPLETGVEG